MKVIKVNKNLAMVRHWLIWKFIITVDNDDGTTIRTYSLNSGRIEINNKP